jgi:fumarylacetoacetate (FAA) hydrolase
VKLATLRTAKPDGDLVVVSRDLARMTRADDIAPTLQAALDAWADVAPRLEERARRLDEGEKSDVFDPRGAHSPLPRAYQWCDGSVYEAHMLRMAKWSNKTVEPQYYEEPWMYQGASDAFLAPTDDIPAASEAWGISTPAGKALFQMMGVFAEFERAMIRERVRAGLERAKAQGKKLGRRRNEIQNALQKSAVCDQRGWALAGSRRPSGLACPTFSG